MLQIYGRRDIEDTVYYPQEIFNSPNLVTLLTEIKSRYSRYAIEKLNKISHKTRITRQCDCNNNHHRSRGQTARSDFTDLNDTHGFAYIF